MKSFKLLITAFAVVLFSINAFAGRRPDINTFSICEQYDLLELMMEYINQPPLVNGLPTNVAEHATNGMPSHNYKEAFLTWHRDYIRDMEEWLLTKNGGPKFVPLPKWNPSNVIPVPFFNTTTVPTFCANSNRNISSLATPTTSFPSLIRDDLTIFSFSDFSRFSNVSNLCAYTAGSSPFRPDNGTAIDNFAADLERQHDRVHVAIGGSMRSATVASGAAIFWLWHAFVDDIYYDYQCECQNSLAPPPVKQKDLYIADSKEDVGVEPNTVTGVLYQSPNIFVRHSNNGFSPSIRYNPLRHQNPEYVETGPPNYVYVEVDNIGCEPISNILVRVYVTDANTNMTWLGGGTNWIELSNSPVSITFAGGEQSKLVEIPWYPPAPTSNGNGHFCLLARIEAPDDPMTNEIISITQGIGANVRNNNNIAWKNLTIVDQFPGAGRILTNLIVRNLSHSANIKLKFSPNGASFLPFGDITVNIAGLIYDRWAAGGFQGEGIENNAGELTIVEDNAWIGNIFLEAEEESAIQIGSEMPIGTPIQTDHVFNFNVEQYEQINQEDIYVGGAEHNFRVDVPCDDITIPENVLINAGHCTVIGEDTENPNIFYEWTPVTGLSDPYASMTNACPTTTTTYALEIFDTASGCLSTQEITIHVDVLCIAPVGNGATIDLGSCTTLGMPQTIANASYIWKKTDGTIIAETAEIEVCPTETTTYELTMTHPETGCETSDEVTVFVLDCPDIDLGDDVIIGEGGSVEIGIEASTMPMIRYYWTPTEGLENLYLSTTQASPTQTTTYTLQQHNMMTGCISESNITVEVSSLPIEFLSFSAHLVKDVKTQLNWTTATEINNSHFNIQHSINGKDWITLEKVQGAGTSNTPQHYNWLHEQPNIGQNFYRLEQVDFNGASTFSPIQIVEIKGEDLIITYQNPIKEELYVEINAPQEELSTFTLYNIKGQLIEQRQIQLQQGTQTLKWKTGHLAQGLYFLKVIGKQTHTLKIVKD